MNKDSLVDHMTKDEYKKVLQKYQKMKLSEFMESVLDIKLYPYQKILVDAFADKRNFMEG